MSTPEDATRCGYDAVAHEYAERLADELDGKPLDRALLSIIHLPPTDRTQAYGELTRVVLAGLTGAGFTDLARVDREPDPAGEIPQAARYLLVRRTLVV